MKEMKILFWLHVVLGPFAAWICWRDWNDPTRWDEWFRNPAYAKPFLVIVEIVMWSLAIYCWLGFRKQDRMKEGMRLMREAVRLLDEGKIAEADELNRQGKKLCGL